MTRVIGHGIPYDHVRPVEARVTLRDGVMSADQAMGAAWVIVAGHQTPRLLANGMEMVYGDNGDNTSILVWYRYGGYFMGDFLRVDGDIVRAEFATAIGQPVVTSDMTPPKIELFQNYPNPFNPTTTIDLVIAIQDLPWKLDIYNITGQCVASFSGVSRGYESVTWNATIFSTGVYFCQLKAGGVVLSRKMLLLK